MLKSSPLIEGNIDIPLRQPADRNDKGSAIGKTVAKVLWVAERIDDTPPVLLREGNEAAEFSR